MAWKPHGCWDLLRVSEFIFPTLFRALCPIFGCFGLFFVIPYTHKLWREHFGNTFVLYHTLTPLISV